MYVDVCVFFFKVNPGNCRKYPLVSHWESSLDIQQNGMGLLWLFLATLQKIASQRACLSTCSIKIHSPHATANTVGLVPVCHAARWDSGSLCMAVFFSDRSRSCRSTYTWMKTPQWGFFFFPAACICTTVQPSWAPGGGHMEGKGLSSKGKLVTPEIFTLWINLHQINAATHW